MLTFVANITLVLALAYGVSDSVAPRLPRSATDAEALGALVGEWQSDTVNGVSARSSCAWTPRHGGLLCEQRIDGPKGASTALNLFTADSSAGGFALYVLSRPGDVMSPIPFAIRGRLWFYGGGKPENDGRYYRTVNDFSQIDAYAWRQETSGDGKEWTVGIHGQSRRVR